MFKTRLERLFLSLCALTLIVSCKADEPVEVTEPAESKKEPSAKGEPAPFFPLGDTGYEVRLLEEVKGWKKADGKQGWTIYTTSEDRHLQYASVLVDNEDAAEARIPQIADVFGVKLHVEEWKVALKGKEAGSLGSVKLAHKTDSVDCRLKNDVGCRLSFSVVALGDSPEDGRVIMAAVKSKFNKWDPLASTTLRKKP